MTAQALTYTSLLSDVETYAERSDQPFIDQIPRFVMLAENRIASEVRGLGYVRVVNLALNQGQYIYEKPIRWRETLAMSYMSETGTKPIFPRSYQYVRHYWPTSTNEAAPDFYADYDYEHFIIVPTPDDTYTAELMYHERPEPLSSTNETNWTTQYAPQLLLYATLLEAQPFLKRSERIQEFQGLYDRAVQALARETKAGSIDDSIRKIV